MHIAKESTKYFTGHGTTLGDRLVVLTDLLASKEDAARIWYSHDAPIAPRLFETLRFGVLEVQEHLETFFDRKDHVLECLESMRNARKTTLFSDTESQHEASNALAASTSAAAAQQASAAAAMDAVTNDILIELGRSLYKLMFQLLLLIESDHKIATNVLASLQQNSALTDLSQLLADTRGALVRSIDDAELDSLDTSTSTEGGDQHTPTPSPVLPMTGAEFEAALVQLVEQQRWSAVMVHVRQHRMSSGTDAGGMHEHHVELSVDVGGSGTMAMMKQQHYAMGRSGGVVIDDLSTVLNVYSQRLVRDRNGE